jgi:hypothetical protein
MNVKTLSTYMKNTWSTIIKNHGQQKHHNRTSSNIMVTNLHKHMIENHQRPRSTIVNNHGQKSSNTRVTNHQKTTDDLDYYPKFVVGEPYKSIVSCAASPVHLHGQPKGTCFLGCVSQASTDASCLSFLTASLSLYT